MLISQWMEKFQEIKDKQGDCEVLIDIPDSSYFITDYEIVDKWFSGNYYNNGSLDRKNVAFVVTFNSGGL